MKISHRKVMLNPSKGLIPLPYRIAFRGSLGSEPLTPKDNVDDGTLPVSYTHICTHAHICPLSLLCSNSSPKSTEHT